ncbi:acetyl-CoA hydrolase/transferase C-terminal domain-containing protein [Sorangium sp. So ce260]
MHGAAASYRSAPVRAREAATRARRPSTVKTGPISGATTTGSASIGGQVDFIRGAARSRGGKPIIALRSTAKDGKISRIQPAFEQGAGIVTSRGDS